MAAPNLGLSSGLAAGADKLYEIVAQREAERIMLAQAAEAQRRQYLKEKYDAADAERSAREIALSEQKFQHERDKPEPLQTETYRDVLGPDGKPTSRTVNLRTGADIVSLPQYQAPRAPIPVRGVLGPDGKPSTQLLDADTLAPRATFTEHVAPPAPRQSSYSFDTLIDAAGNPVMIKRDSSTGAISPVDTGGLRPAPSGGGGQAPRQFHYTNLTNYENMRSSDEILSGLESGAGLSNKDLSIINDMADVPATLQGLGLSDAGQAYVQAARVYLESIGRARSGAAISASEWKNFRRESLALPFEPESVREAKRTQRQREIALKAQASGPAFEEKYGHTYTPPERRVKVTRGADGKLIVPR